jgi:hypothetical protein
MAAEKQVTPDFASRTFHRPRDDAPDTLLSGVGLQQILWKEVKQQGARGLRQLVTETDYAGQRTSPEDRQKLFLSATAAAPSATLNAMPVWPFIMLDNEFVPLVWARCGIFDSPIRQHLREGEKCPVCGGEDVREEHWMSCKRGTVASRTGRHNDERDLVGRLVAFVRSSTHSLEFDLPHLGKRADVRACFGEPRAPRRLLRGHPLRLVRRVGHGGHRGRRGGAEEEE